MLARVENGRAKTLAENSPVNIAALVDFVEYTLDDIKGTVIGDVAEVQLVDKDGDIIASAGERVFTKTPGKGLYIAFKYNILEVEVESSNESL